MNRFAYNQLLEWNKSENSSLLIVGGVPGVGKRSLILEFAGELFDSYQYIDLSICRDNLSDGLNKSDKNCLIIFNNILGDKDVLLNIKRLSEEFTNYQFIIIDPFAKEARGDGESISASYLVLYPLTFEEFLYNVNSPLFSELATLTNISTMSSELHSRLIEIFRDYLIVGGMPSVVKQYINEGLNFSDIRAIQGTLLDSIFETLSEYYKTTEFKNLMNIIKLILPTLSRDNRKFKLADISLSKRFSSFSRYFRILENLNLIYISKQIKGNSLEVDDKSMILYFFDVGLLGSLGNIPLQLYNIPTLLSNQVSLGICSNFVGGEIFSTVNLPLYFWSSNMSKVEYLFKIRDNVFPVELKDDNSGKLKSLDSFHRVFSSSELTRINLKKADSKGNVKTYPIYLIKSLYRKYIS